PQIGVAGATPTTSFNPNQVSSKVQAFWTNQIQPLAPGGAYTISGCTGTDSHGNAIVLGTTSPVVAAYDLFCSTQFNDSLALYDLDTYGIPDFNGANGGNPYYPATG